MKTPVFKPGFFFDRSFTLRYERDPLDFIPSGGVNFFEDAGLEPAPELSAALRYQITPRTDPETGIELSNDA